MHLLYTLVTFLKMRQKTKNINAIEIQQDNAKLHILDNDPIFREAANQGGFNIHLIQQPPNSPDMNVLDLGFF